MQTPSSSDLAALGSPARLATEAIGRMQARMPLAEPRTSVLLKTASLRLQERIHHCLEPHGLSHGDYLTLLALHSQPERVGNPSTLAEAISETRTNTTRICDRLTRRGLISRVGSKVDRRRVELALTEDGRALIESALRTFPRMTSKVYAVFTPEERACLDDLLERLARRLEALPVAPLRQDAPRPRA